MNNLNHRINQYKYNIESVYTTWFVDNDQRLIVFKTLRRGIIQVMEDVKKRDVSKLF